MLARLWIVALALGLVAGCAGTVGTDASSAVPPSEYGDDTY